MGIKAILFDFGGTLDSDGGHWYARLYNLTAKQIDISSEVFWSYAVQAAAAMDLLSDTRTLSMRATVQRLNNHIQAAMKNNSADFKNWNTLEVTNAFCQEGEQFLKRNYRILEELKSNFTLGCISNNWGNVAGWCRDYGFDALFEVMVDSTLENSAKPDEKIFRTALQSLNLTGQQCAYVGDDYNCDVLGASAVGMLPVWLNPQQLPDDQKTKEMPLQIHSLLDLPQLAILNFL